MSGHYNTAPTGVPLNLVATVTSRTITVTWEPIACIERNGIIEEYSVIFNELGGRLLPGVESGRSFSAEGLQPFTFYTFQVAGVSRGGLGPYTPTDFILTNEEGKSNCTYNIASGGS